MPEINQHGQTVNDIVPDWKCARALTRTLLTGQYCRLEPLDADRHSADLFEAYALGDDSDWTWLASTQPVSVEATAHWVLGKVLDDDLVPFAVIDLRTEKAVGLVSYMAIERFQGSVEIGHVTWSRRMKGTRVGTEAVWLDMVYLPVYYRQGVVVPAASPFRLEADGTVRIMSDDGK